MKILGYLGALAWWTLYPLLIVALAPVEAAPRYPCQGAGDHRSKTAIRQFMQANPCPGGRDKGSVTRCRGYEIHHACPLACCGLDAPQNMVWLTKAAHRALKVDCAACGLKVGG
jgi:hypothetical protein